ncbi:MAG TPA: ATP-binding cassette domain-containing protein, partial [Actinomycetota bacterium]|nr:ATP-binding cassette domain-containing protein [Actinomycetota bacterium]
MAVAEQGWDLRVTGLTMSFTSRRSGTIHVLDGVDLALEDGTFCCIVGPSGCGKSTMLRIVDGLVKPDAGQVHIGGELVRGPDLSRGFVFQQFNLLPWRTVLGNVEFGLENLGIGKQARRDRARHWV